MNKKNWQILEGAIILLFAVGIAVTAVSPFSLQMNTSYLDLYDLYTISSERKIGKCHRLTGTFTLHGENLTEIAKPQITMMILTQENYQLLLANDSSAIIHSKSVINRPYGNIRFEIPSRDIWFLVFNNTNYSSTFGDTYAGYTIKTNTNFYNLALVMSLIIILAIGILLSLILTPIITKASGKQSKLDEE